MPNDQFDRFEASQPDEAFRSRQAAKAQKRKKQRTQQLIVVVVFLVAVILLVICIISIFGAIFGKKTPSAPSAPSIPASAPVASTPTEGPGVSWPVAPDPTVWNLILVNNQHPLPEGFEVETRTVTNIGHTFDARAADALLQMVGDCNAVEGHNLTIYSGWRGQNKQNENNQRQISIFKAQGYSDEEATAMARQLEPPAGYSEHQTGLAVDFITPATQEPDVSFAQTPEFAWLLENAATYGFILRYPSEKESITGMIVQPYHFRYVGPEDAAVMKQAGICLEEYLAALPEPEAQPEITPEAPAEGEAAPSTPAEA